MLGARALVVWRQSGSTVTYPRWQHRRACAGLKFLEADQERSNDQKDGQTVTGQGRAAQNQAEGGKNGHG